MVDLVRIGAGTFQNGHFYRSRTLVAEVLEEITTNLYEAGVRQAFLPKPLLVEVNTPKGSQIMYSKDRREIQVPKWYFSEIERKLEANEKSARDEIEFVLGRFYGRHVFRIFTGYQGIDEANQGLYREFVEIFSNWFRDIMYPSNPHVIERANKGFNEIEEETRRKLTKKLIQQGYFELFQSLADYFFETFLKDTSPLGKPPKKHYLRKV